MTPKKICGEMVQCEMPSWDPLLNFLAEILAGDFMWMHEVELKDGTRLDAYKHRETRRYLHLSADGHAFVFCEDEDGDCFYREVEELRTMLDQVLLGRYFRHRASYGQDLEP